MDQKKIGAFIAACRKKQGLTQAELAEHLNITDRAVSKWETGRAMPDCAVMPELCRIFRISINDLFYGEVMELEKYNEKTEELLLEMAKQKEEADRRLLALEILIGILSVIVLLGFTFAASFFEMHAGLRIGLIVFGFAVSLVGLFYAIKIEQTAGYYLCTKCGHRHVPSFHSVLFAMHVNRTRFMRCPKCGKRSWQKKVISKE
ncbi:MAG: helix-turn-helix transcriptional regulator [Clostridia bacterium]|nr:helix-turn-helix transcriptional regulator [Clostridia bacterium]